MKYVKMECMKKTKILGYKRLNNELYEKCKNDVYENGKTCCMKKI